MMVGRLLSYWEGHFSGAMLNFGRVLVLILVFLSQGSHCALFLQREDQVWLGAKGFNGFKGETFQHSSFWDGKNMEKTQQGHDDAPLTWYEINDMHA